MSEKTKQQLPNNSFSAIAKQNSSLNFGYHLSYKIPICSWSAYFKWAKSHLFVLKDDSCAFEIEISLTKRSEHLPYFTWSLCKLYCWSTLVSH